MTERIAFQWKHDYQDRKCSKSSMKQTGYRNQQKQKAEAVS